MTSNDLENVGDGIRTRKHGETEIHTGEITGEEILRALAPS